MPPSGTEPMSLGGEVMGNPLTREVVEALRTFCLTHTVRPTHIYMTSEYMKCLGRELPHVVYASLKVFGMTIIVDTMPPNVKGEFFVAG